MGYLFLHRFFRCPVGIYFFPTKYYAVVVLTGYLFTIVQINTDEELVFVRVVRGLEKGLYV